MLTMLRSQAERGTQADEVGLLDDSRSHQGKPLQHIHLQLCQFNGDGTSLGLSTLTRIVGNPPYTSHCSAGKAVQCRYLHAASHLRSSAAGPQCRNKGVSRLAV